MTYAMNVCSRLVRDERGTEVVEYALLLGLIALVIFATMLLLGVNFADFYSSVATAY